jgi:hypothetical protein
MIFPAAPTEHTPACGPGLVTADAAAADDHLDGLLDPAGLAGAAVEVFARFEAPSCAASVTVWSCGRSQAVG